MKWTRERRYNDENERGKIMRREAPPPTGWRAKRQILPKNFGKFLSKNFDKIFKIARFWFPGSQNLKVPKKCSGNGQYFSLAPEFFPFLNGNFLKFRAQKLTQNFPFRAIFGSFSSSEISGKSGKLGLTIGKIFASFSRFSSSRWELENLEKLAKILPIVRLSFSRFSGNFWSPFSWP